MVRALITVMTLYRNCWYSSYGHNTVESLHMEHPVTTTVTCYVTSVMLLTTLCEYKAVTPCMYTLLAMHF